MERINVKQELILKSIWFTCASISQTFERTSRSREDILYHAWRIFTGKLGELTFANWLVDKNLLSLEDYKKYENNALSVFWGNTNVDEFDLHVNGYLIDIKTLPEHSHKYLIIPKDQFENQPKDIYVCLRLEHSLNNNKMKIKLLNKNCFEIYTLLKNNTIKEQYRFTAEILGFIERRTTLFEFYEKDAICPEKSCYRIHINRLSNIRNLFPLLNLLNWEEV